MVDDGGEGVVLTIRVVGDTASTNADLLAAAAAGAEDGTWLRAERQHAGRGRLGRAWADGAGNLFTSTIVRLRPGDPAAPTLTLVAAVALAEAVDAIAPGLATIKWPNDLLVGTAKLSGILLERGTGNAVVIGFGVNIATHPVLADRPTTSLAAQGISIEPAVLFDRLRDRFSAWLSAWRSDDLAAIRSAWEGRAHPRGAPLMVRLPDGSEQTGTFDGLDRGGGLRLIRADGVCTTIHAGDVLTGVNPANRPNASVDSGDACRGRPQPLAR